MKTCSERRGKVEGIRDIGTVHSWVIGFTLRFFWLWQRVLDKRWIGRWIHFRAGLGTAKANKQTNKKKAAVTRNQANTEYNLIAEPGWAQSCSKQKIRCIFQDTSFDHPANKNAVLQNRYNSITSLTENYENQVLMWFYIIHVFKHETISEEFRRILNCQWNKKQILLFVSQFHNGLRNLEVSLGEGLLLLRL